MQVEKNMIFFPKEFHLFVAAMKWNCIYVPCKKMNCINLLLLLSMILNLTVKCLHLQFDWQGDLPLRYPQKDLVIYEMHLRGFTKHSSSNVEHPGTYIGAISKLDYLKVHFTNYLVRSRSYWATEQFIRLLHIHFL